MSEEPPTERKNHGVAATNDDTVIETHDVTVSVEADREAEPYNEMTQPAQPSTSPNPRGAHNAPSKPTNRPSTAPFAHSYAYEEVGEGSDATGLFRFVHPLIFCAMCFIFITFVLLLVAIPTVNWYVRIHGDATYKYGLYRMCEDDDCEAIKYQDLKLNDCERSASGWKFRNNVAQGTAIASVALSMVVFVVGFLSKRALTEHRCAAIIAVACVTIFLLLLGGAVRFVYTYELWLYCDENFCDYMKKIDDPEACDASFGYSFGLMLIAMGSAFVASIFMLIKLACRDVIIAKKREVTRTSPVGVHHSPQHLHMGAVDSGSPPPGSPPPPVMSSSDAAPVERDITGKPKGLPAPPPGDWEFHDDCGLYWSADEFLYLDPHTRHYYDPQSDMWYDPDADQWYEGTNQ